MKHLQRDNQEIVTHAEVEEKGALVVGWDNSEMIAQKTFATYPEPSLELGLFSFEDLTNQVQDSELSDGDKQDIQDKLEHLRIQLTNGEDIDLKTTRVLLEEIGTTLPTLRKPLWQWLSSHQDVPSPVKIVARRLLNS